MIHQSKPCILKEERMVRMESPRILKEDGKDGILKLLTHGMVFYISDMCLLSFFLVSFYKE